MDPCSKYNLDLDQTRQSLHPKKKTELALKIILGIKAHGNVSSLVIRYSTFRYLRRTALWSSAEGNNDSAVSQIPGLPDSRGWKSTQVHSIHVSNLIAWAF